MSDATNPMPNRRRRLKRWSVLLGLVLLIAVGVVAALPWLLSTPAGNRLIGNGLAKAFARERFSRGVSAIQNGEVMLRVLFLIGARGGGGRLDDRFEIGANLDAAVERFVNRLSQRHPTNHCHRAWKRFIRR